MLTIAILKVTLSLSEPVAYGFQPKTSSLHVSLHGNISGAKSARELFKPSKDLASLLVSNEKKCFLVLGCRFL